MAVGCVLYTLEPAELGWRCLVLQHDVYTSYVGTCMAFVLGGGSFYTLMRL